MIKAAMIDKANKKTGKQPNMRRAGLAALAMLLLGASFAGYGVDTNTPWVVTGNTTIAPQHCMGTILAGTGSTGQFTLTLPAVTGFPSNCSVLIKNGDTTNGKFLSGFPSDLATTTILWPQQSVGVKIVNSAWQTFYNPGRWNLRISPTIYVNGNSGTTNNTTSAGNNTLNFAATPAAFVNGATIADVTTPAAIPPGTTVSSATGTTVVMSANAASPGVGNGDVIAVSATCGYTGASACSPGNDTNDGLSPSTPLLTPTKALANVFSFIDTKGKLPSINLAHGLNPGFLCAQGALAGNAALPITGDNTSINAVKISGSVSAKDFCFLTLRSLEVDGGSQTDVNCDFYGGLDLRSVTLGATTATGASADHGCIINFTGQDGSAATNSLQIGTGAVAALQTYRGAHISLPSPTNIPSNITVSVAFYFTEGGYLDGLTGTPFTGAGVVTGPKCFIADTASNFDGNPNTYLPGTSNCPYPFLPNPSASTLGGIESIVAAAHNWIASIDTSGVPHQSQPAIADLSNGGALPTILGQSHIPFVLVSSGTMGNNGALSGITGVQATYPNAYCYLPAGAISSGSAAGWYYCVFSSSTTATVYNNTYTSGTPGIPGSPTAFSTTGPGAYTQTTSNIAAYTLAIPGNTIGANGTVEILGSVSHNNTAGAKTLTMNYDAYAFGVLALGTNVNSGIVGGFSNRGVTNVQTALTTNQLITNADPSMTFGAIDSTASKNLIANMQLTAATDTMVLENIVLKLLPGVP